MPYTIVLVENDDALRFITRQALLILDAEVIECVHAEQALQQLQARPVDLLLVDAALAGRLDGLQLCRRVWHGWPEVPVILTSRHALIGSAVLPTHCRFLAKPWSLDQLLTAASACLHGDCGHWLDGIDRTAPPPAATLSRHDAEEWLS